MTLPTPLLPTTRGAATKTVEALRWLTPAALVSSSADNNAHQLIVSWTASRPLLPWELKRCGNGLQGCRHLLANSFRCKAAQATDTTFFNPCCFSSGRGVLDGNLTQLL